MTEHAVFPTAVLIVAAVTITALAATAGLLGFSLAIGAFFAGLVFSRDPKAVRIEASFDVLYELFVPFFFVGLGVLVAPGSLGGALGVAAALLAAAVAGKLAGTAIPAAPLMKGAGAGAIALSMVPRAETAMVIMRYGHRLGECRQAGR
ncbi:MAG: hypothetical protein GF400_07065 [Candidatus Eisenbacteria bacterium]|nr:hypothetical protein [Candidatus Eisenbacteria bacterium]